MHRISPGAARIPLTGGPRSRKRGIPFGGARRHRDSPGPVFLLGLPIVLSGAAIYLWTTRGFVSVERGPAVPVDPPRVLVVRGLYRVIRNPMALGFTLILIGDGVAFGSLGILAYGGVLLATTNSFIVFVEEP